MNKILLVEDDADITANLQTFLAKEGFEVDCADGQKKAGIRPVERHADIAHQMHRAGHGQRQQTQDHDRRDPFSGVPAPAILHRRRLRLPVLCGIVVIEAVIVKAHIRHLLA